MIRSQNLNSICSCSYQKHDYIYKIHKMWFETNVLFLLLYTLKKFKVTLEVCLHMYVGIQAERLKAWNRKYPFHGNKCRLLIKKFGQKQTSFQRWHLIETYNFYNGIFNVDVDAHKTNKYKDCWCYSREENRWENKLSE